MGLLMIFWQRFTLRLFTVLMCSSLIGVVTTIIALAFIDKHQLATGFAKFGGVNSVTSQAHKAGLGSSAFKPHGDVRVDHNPVRRDRPGPGVVVLRG